MKKFYIIVMIICTSYFCYGQDQITTYKLLTSNPVQYEKTEFDIEASGSYTNPFDQKDIALDLILVSPSGREIIQPCYFVSGSSGKSVWKARFSAQETGRYSYYFRISKNNLQSAVSASDSFSAQAAKSSNDGFLHKNNYWTFKFDSGKLFRGVGENVGWESRSWENSKWTYDYLLTSLSNAKANFFRTWMCPWNLAVEWKQVKDTKRYTSSNAYFNESGIKRMDELVTMAENLKLYIMLSLDWHGALIEGDGWTQSNYNKANGGPAANPTEFFTLDAAKAKYKNRLRYLVARWGYSTSIGAWEFFNEIDNSAFNSSNVVRIPLSAVAQWHDEMSTYLKQIDPYGHLVTTSVSHRDIPGMNAVKNMDFNQKHIYKNTDAISPTIKSYITGYNKPYVIGEFGFRWEDDNPAYSADFNYDYKRGLWYGIFTPTPILPMTWWWELFDTNKMTPYMTSVREISDQMIEAGQGNFEPLEVLAGSAEAYGMRCGDKYFVCLLNNTSYSITVKPSFSVSKNQVFKVKSLSPFDHIHSDLDDVEVVNNRVFIPNVTIKANDEMLLVLGNDFVQPGSPVPELYALEQNYPNPFNPGTIIKYSLPLDSKVKISVYNLLGKLVATLVDREEKAGDVEIKFDASKFSSGVYFYSIQVNSLDGTKSFNKVKKMSLVK